MIPIPLFVQSYAAGWRKLLFKLSAIFVILSFFKLKNALQRRNRTIFVITMRLYNFYFSLFVQYTKKKIELTK